MSSPLPHEAVPPGATRPSLRHRRAGHAVMLECLRRVEEHGLVQGEHGTALPPEAMSWRIGADGEREIGLELGFLPSGWTVLHSIPVGTRGADIDHLVIGPGGVFVLNTKTHRGANVRVGTHVVWVGADSDRQPYQRDLQHRVDQVQRVLAPELGGREVVRPLLVFVDPHRLWRVGPQHVASCTPADLVAVLLAAPPVLAEEVVAALVARAERPETWGAPASAAFEEDPTARFLALPPASTTPSAPARARAPRSATPPRRPSAAVQVIRTLVLVAAGYAGVTAVTTIVAGLLAAR